MSVLSAKQLLIGHHRNPLCEPISFQLDEGDCLAILGRNGSGKSTLIQTLCKLIPSLGGEMYLRDKSIASLSPRNLATRVSVVFPGRRDIVGQVRVKEILKLGRFPYTDFFSGMNATDKKLIEETTELLQLGGFLEHHIGELSDGEAQKVMIGRALIQDTQVILFDEPTSHLDVFNRKEILDILTTLRSRNKTILIATHEIRTALTLSSHCLLFSKPEIHFGHTGELLQKHVFDEWLAIEA